MTKITVFKGNSDTVKPSEIKKTDYYPSLSEILAKIGSYQVVSGSTFSATTLYTVPTDYILLLTSATLSVATSSTTSVCLGQLTNSNSGDILATNTLNGSEGVSISLDFPIIMYEGSQLNTNIGGGGATRGIAASFTGYLVPKALASPILFNY